MQSLQTFCFATIYVAKLDDFMFIVYFITIPYLAGLGFLYLFIAKGDFSNFLNFKISSFFVIWAIGYEVVAAILLTLIINSFIKSFKSVA